MVRVFSFCLYGPENPRYYENLRVNLELITQYFPDFKIYLYIGADVPQSYMDSISGYSNVVVRHTEKLGSVNMIYRYFAIDEPDVEIAFIRDADSHVHWRDRWTIRQFLGHPEYVAHTIRDNRVHTAPLMGGLTGLRKSVGISMQREYNIFAQSPEYNETRRLGLDQDFLRLCIYPRIKHRLLVHYGASAPTFMGEDAFAIPFEWRNDIYCGRVEGFS